MAIEDLAVQRCQFKHLQLRAIGSHNNVRISRPKELHIQNLIIVTCKLRMAEQKHLNSEKLVREVLNGIVLSPEAELIPKYG